MHTSLAGSAKRGLREGEYKMHFEKCIIRPDSKTTPTCYRSTMQANVEKYAGAGLFRDRWEKYLYNYKIFKVEQVWCVLYLLYNAWTFDNLKISKNQAMMLMMMITIFLLSGRQCGIDKILNINQMCKYQSTLLRSQNTCTQQVRNNEKPGTTAFLVPFCQTEGGWVKRERRAETVFPMMRATTMLHRHHHAIIASKHKRSMPKYSKTTGKYQE